MQKQIKLLINVNNDDSSRCGTRDNGGMCQFLEKRRGTYHCLVWDEDVDNGDDDRSDDYLFYRCPQCKKAEVNFGD